MASELPDSALELYNLLESRVFALEAKIAPEWAVKYERDSSKEWQARARDKHEECNRMADAINRKNAEIAELQKQVDALTLELKGARERVRCCGSALIVRKSSLGYITSTCRLTSGHDGECKP